MKKKFITTTLRAIITLIIVIIIIISSDHTRTNTPTQKPKAGEYLVTKVVDGDTVKIELNGTEETVRLIGIDTPETVKPNTSVECFGVEASNKLKDLIAGKYVKIEYDKTQNERDRYNRLLLYLYKADDGQLINELMIKEGYAFEYTYEKPYKFQSLFQNLEKTARENQLGLWGRLCDYSANTK